MRHKGDPGRQLWLPVTLRIIGLIGSTVMFSLAFNPNCGLGQSLPITPSALHTQVSDLGTAGGHIQYDITGGTRPGGGENLFHSFGNFNVPANSIANFLNTGSVDLNGIPLPSNLPTSNILARVTDQQNPSMILGMIQTNGPGGFDHANFFLMNPHGFLFGENATVNVGGMVAFTTANHLRLADGVQFNATPDIASDALLTASPVAAFGFLSSNAASIAIQGGRLEVADGKTLSFIGGPGVYTTDTGVTVPSGVSMSGGSLSAPNGLIYMASVTSPGEILVPTLSGSPLGPLGTPHSDPAIIRIQSGEFVMDHAFLTATNTSDASQPAIDVNAQGAIALKNASAISTESFGAGQGSTVNITAQSLQMDGSSIKSTTVAAGPGGNISIEGQTLSLINGAQIASETTGTGAGGNITIAAANTLSISGYDPSGALSGVTTLFFSDPNTGLPLVTSGVFSTTSGTDAGGSITIQTGTATLDNAGTLASIASGNGRGGDITLNVGTLNIQNGSLMFTTAGLDLTTGDLKGNGRGGNINVIAQDSIQISQFNPNFFFTGGMLSWASNTGDGGNVTLSASNFLIENGGVIQSTGFGTGNAGNITIEAEQMSVLGVDDFGNSSQISSISPAANSGTITIAAQSVNITDLGFLQTVGNGGDITIQAAQNVNVTGVSAIQSVGGDTGLSGDIAISADQVLVSGQNEFSQSRIETVSGGLAETGTITLNVRELVVTDGGRINTENTVNGTALGGIQIAATESVTVSDEGKIRMENIVGPAGPIVIDAPTITLNQGIIQTESLSGNAGSVTLHADNLTLAGGFINTKVTQDVPGHGGNVTINVTDTISISGQFNGNVVGDNPRPAGIYADTAGTLPGGDISVTAGNLISLSGPGAGLYSQSLGSSGNGGNISVNANSVTLQNGAHISSSSTSTGDAGNVHINAGNQLLMTNSSVTTEATHSGGGAIKVTTNPGGTVHLTDSMISASVRNGAGGGGSVDIDPLFVILQNSQILATAIHGPGGNIFITTDLLLQDGNSVISASSQFGSNGTITIQSPNAPISGQIQPLGKSPLLATTLLTQRCAAQDGGAFSSFTVAGRDRLPTEPGSWLTSPLVAFGDGEGLGVRGKGREGLGAREGHGGVRVGAGQGTRGKEQGDDRQMLSIRQIAPAGFLTRSFAVDQSAGCRS